MQLIITNTMARSGQIYSTAATRIHDRKKKRPRRQKSQEEIFPSAELLTPWKDHYLVLYAEQSRLQTRADGEEDRDRPQIAALHSIDRTKKKKKTGLMQMIFPFYRRRR